ncbi:lysosomal alpha-mannosidase [Octopus sinensis]|uniref:Alpha-mannosidase n=1 Tax=Octopus sinensis TaxID=2607531 RepID=A0A6P7SEM8_9MOLL|nr:lysosomal alpha-mannosidase [Octopus sinensis]
MMTRVFCIFLSFLLVVGNQAYPFHSQSCGYESCNPVKDGMINVHLVPHTHDDVGWLKTVDQYFYGAKTKIQNAGVQYILDSVIQELLKDPSRRFIYVEMAFFWRWWHQQHDHTRHIVQKLVKEGRLEFILGGWTMNDEAATHYSAIIDQHTLGFEFLSKTFGECGRPRVAWQIDPFGHSKEMASLFAGMGFDGLFFGRADYQDIVKRVLNKDMEMVWKANQNIGEEADLFTGILLNGYNPPPGFCFDELCQDDPIMDDPRLKENNLNEKLILFSTWVMMKSLTLRTKHIMLTMGSDFQYSNANTWYKNLDKLIKHINAKQAKGSKLNLIYSTPSCYLYQLNRANISWPVKTDDFFPYADRLHSYWTGYFTSRPAIKQFIRESSNLFQVSRHLDVFAQLQNHIDLFRVWEPLSIAQHHDAVTGTEKQAVANDYTARLTAGAESYQKLTNAAYTKLLPKTEETPPAHYFCSLLNISMCEITEHLNEFTVTLYNPLAQLVSNWVRLPVVGSSYTVLGPDLNSVQTQVITISSSTKRIPERRLSKAQNILVFEVKIRPLGFATYFVQTTKSDDAIQRTLSQVIPVDLGTDFEIKNDKIAISFNGKTGRMQGISNLESKISASVVQDYYYYIGHPGNNSDTDTQASNNYIFRPLNNTPSSVNYLMPVKSHIVKGPLVQEVHQVFCPWITQVIRLYKGSNFAEVEWTAGSIPINDDKGKEIVVSYQTNLKTNNMFYTDANGRQIMERKLNYRPTWTLKISEPISGNYYPVNTKIFIKDVEKDVQFTVLTDRSQGGSSLRDGHVELMLHRRLLFDDGRGVGEPLNETGVDGHGLIIRGKHLLYVDTKENSTVFHRHQAIENFLHPTIAFAELKMSPKEWKDKFNTNWAAMKSSLPSNVNLLTLQQWGKSTLLLRLEHVFEQGEGTFSKSVTISLKNLFIHFNATAVEELVLGANLNLSDLHRLKWKADGYHTNNHYFKKQEGLEITLSPMEIKTLAVTITDFF